MPLVRDYRRKTTRRRRAAELFEAQVWRVYAASLGGAMPQPWAGQRLACWLRLTHPKRRALTQSQLSRRLRYKYTA